MFSLGAIDHRTTDCKTTSYKGTVAVFGVRVPVVFQQVKIMTGCLKSYKLDGNPTITIPKTKVPRELATFINDELKEATTAIMKSNPNAIAAPAKLLAQAKQKIGLTGTSDWFKSLTPTIQRMLPKLGWLQLGNISEIDGIDVAGKHWITVVKEQGSSYVMSFMVANNDGTITGAANKLLKIVVKPYELLQAYYKQVVNLAKDGVEALLDAVQKVLNALCPAAQQPALQAAAAAVTGGTSAAVYAASATGFAQQYCGTAPAPIPTGASLDIKPFLFIGAGLVGAYILLKPRHAQ